MARKYNYSITLGEGTFTVEGCDSFEEAVKIIQQWTKEWQAARLAPPQKDGSNEKPKSFIPPNPDPGNPLQTVPDMVIPVEPGQIPPM